MIAILSDIHSNLPALRRILRYLDRIGVSQIVSLGDQVGYNAFPKETLELLEERKAVMLLGNHDSMLLGREDMRFYRDTIVRPIRFARNQLSVEQIEMLEQLPTQIRIEGMEQVLFVHSEPINPEAFEYIHNAWDAANIFGISRVDFDVCFYGHTHVPVAYMQRRTEHDLAGVDTVYQNEWRGWLPLHADHRYLINPGSVGQPRDRDPRTSFLLFDPEKMRIRWVRLNYGIDEVQAANGEAGFDPILSDRLLVGR